MAATPDLRWEDIEPLDFDTHSPQMNLERAKVPGGWLYRASIHSVERFATTPTAVSICFVPDSSQNEEIPY